MQRLIDINLSWHLSWDRKGKYYYVRAMQGYYKNDGTYGEHTIYLHRFIMNAPKGYVVDHKEGVDKLDNRKINLRIVEQQKNTSNRKGANNNSSTGVRNVNYIQKLDEYWVQIMKHGERYKWVFPGNMFKEACELAEVKRKEIFGKYAGKGQLE